MKKNKIEIGYEEIKQRFLNKGLYLLDKNITSSKQKLTCVDKDGYLYSINYNNISNLKKPERFNKFNPYTIKNIQKYLNNVSNGTQILSNKFYGSKNKLNFLCPECGKEYTRIWDDVYIRHKYYCYECTKKKSSNHLKYNIDFAKKILKENGYKLLEDKYYGNNYNMLCEDQNGYRVYTKLSNFTAKIYHKPSIFSVFYNSDNFIYNINNYFSINNIHCKALYYIVDKNKYNGVPSIYCQCECGEVFCTNIDLIKQGQIRCTKCSSYFSIIEIKIKEWLDKKHICYERQKTFEGCVDKRKLPFDYYLPKYNLCIEVDGRQHDSPQKFYNCSEEEARKDFLLRKKHDELKTKYCLDNGIELLRIKEKDIKRSNKYKEILYNKLIKE